MSRAHTQSAYDFRSLGIAGFVVAVSFFANAVPVLAAGTASDAGGIYSSREEYSGPTPGSAGYSGRTPGGRDEYSGPTPGSALYSGRTSGRGGGYDGYGSKGAGSPGLGSGNAGAPTVADLQDQLQKLTALKAQLEKLIASFKHSTTTVDRFTHCRPMNHLTLGSVSSSTQQTCVDDSGWRPAPLPKACNVLSGECSAKDEKPVTQPFHCPRLLQGATGSTTVRNCIDDSGMYPGRLSSSTAPTARGTSSHCPPLDQAAINRGERRSCPDDNGMPRYNFGGTGGSSSGVSPAYGGRSSYGNDNTYSGVSPLFVGSVRGASSDMSAEIAEVLGGLTSDLLDIRDALGQ